MADARADMYKGVEFPPYAFKEFPKWMDHPSGERVLVGSQREELKILSESPEKTIEQNAADRERNELAQALADAQKQIADLTNRLNKPSPAPQTSPDAPKQVTKIEAPGTATTSGSDPAGGAAMAPVVAAPDSSASPDKLTAVGPALPPPAAR